MALSFKTKVETLEMESVPIDGSYCKTANRGFWYYDAMKEGRVSGPTIYRQLIESAQRLIGVWDTYLQERDANLFNNISSKIELKILTTVNQKDEEDRNIDNYYRFLEKLKKIQEANGFSLIMQGICKSSHQKNSTARIPHDRFLFVDDRVFIVGSSLHYHSIEDDAEHIIDVANTTVTELFADENKEILKNDFDSYFDKTSPHYKYSTELCNIPGFSIR